LTTSPHERTVAVLADAAELASAGAGLFAEQAGKAVAARGRFMVALAGGTTPSALYGQLVADYRDVIPWHAIHFFWGDERHVPPAHPDSNFQAAYDAMLSRVPVPRAHIHRIHAELPAASIAAAEYERTLRREFALGADALPVFDLVLLGMGADGHTASLFPGSGALHHSEHLVLAPWVQGSQSYRITLSLPVLNHARLVVFLVSGVEKAETLRAVLEGLDQPEVVPAQAVRPSGGRLVWMVDRAAAARLRQYS
jgi:6-phosphogluconolactonase